MSGANRNFHFGMRLSECFSTSSRSSARKVIGGIVSVSKAMIDSSERDQRGLAAPVIHLAGEQGMGGGKQHQRTLTSAFLVAAVQVMELLLDRRLHDRERDLAADDHRLDGAGRATIFE